MDTKDDDKALAIVLAQAKDEGLWFKAQTAPEAYLQQELRRLHAAVEADDDKALLDWLERNLFDRKWDGNFGHPYTWHMRADYRHTLQRMSGDDIRTAIRAAKGDTPIDRKEG